MSERVKVTATLKAMDVSIAAIEFDVEHGQRLPTYIRWRNNAYVLGANNVYGAIPLRELGGGDAGPINMGPGEPDIRFTTAMLVPE